jgi:uncharacterized RDD family membrane protein YckC
MPQGGNTAYTQGWAGHRGDVLPDGAVLAEWWRRLVGRVLDIMVTGGIAAIVALPWLSELASTMSTFVTRTIDAQESGGTLPSQTEFAVQFLESALPAILIWIVVSMVYETTFLVWRSATPGKIVVGTVVRRVGGPGRLSVATALKRQIIPVSTVLLNFVPIVSIFAFGVGVVDPAWLLWDPKRQALHDKVADTVVVLRSSQR